MHIKNCKANPVPRKRNGISRRVGRCAEEVILQNKAIWGERRDREKGTTDFKIAQIRCAVGRQGKLDCGAGCGHGGAAPK